MDEIDRQTEMESNMDKKYSHLFNRTIPQDKKIIPTGKLEEISIETVVKALEGKILSLEEECKADGTRISLYNEAVSEKPCGRVYDNRVACMCSEKYAIDCEYQLRAR